jgi:hypothetical protein
VLPNHETQMETEANDQRKLAFSAVNLLFTPPSISQ